MAPHYAFQVKMRMMEVREATGPQARTAADFAAAFQDIAGAGQEMFFVVTLDTKNKTIDRHMISMGTLTASLVHPREVYRPALLDGAAAVAFVHNHPSGDTTPSPEDRALTRRLCEAGHVLGLRILDHVIIGRHGYHSFLEQGEMPQK
jgi:DNA repair protein RadC